MTLQSFRAVFGIASSMRIFVYLCQIHKDLEYSNVLCPVEKAATSMGDTPRMVFAGQAKTVPYFTLS